MAQTGMSAAGTRKGKTRGRTGKGKLDLKGKEDAVLRASLKSRKRRVFSRSIPHKASMHEDKNSQRRKKSVGRKVRDGRKEGD